MSDEGRKEGEESPVTDADPAATLRLRGPAPRVTRLSRKVLAGLGAVALFGIGGALIYALQPGGDDSTRDELYRTGSGNTADELQTLPRDYGGLPQSEPPQLGPPLPGDLGRPIVRSGAEPPVIRAPDTDPDAQRRLEEIEAARASQLFASTQTDPASPEGAEPGLAQVPASPDLAELGLAPNTTTPSAQERQQDFLDAPVDRDTVSAERLAPPASPNILQAGSVIPAALITGIRSDLPGQITAQVTENVHDSPTGRILLIPQGSRLIGTYDNEIGAGQRRVLLVWTRLIMPDGRSIVLDRQPGADREGFAGLEDGVDHHWLDIAKAAGLSTLLNVGAELAINDEDRLVRALRDGAQGTIGDAGEEIVRRQLAIPPTLTIRAGFPVRVIVTRDLVLEPYGDRP